MLYILLGPDDFSINESLESIKQSLGDQSLLAVNTTVLDGQRLPLAELQAFCETVPFLAEKRLVIVRGLLERFEVRGKPRQRKKAGPAANGEDDYRSLAGCLTQLPASTVVVLMDGRVADGNPLLKELSGQAKVVRYPLLKDSELRQWIQRRVTRVGGSISPQAVSLLARVIGNNLWIMSNEISKLVLFASGRRIEEADVETAVSYAQEASVFAMVDAILEAKPGVAEKLLKQLLLGGAAPAYLLFMLSRRVQLIVRAGELRRRGEPRPEIQSKLNVQSEFALRRTLEQADRYPMPQIKEVYRKLLETDLAIKTGRYEAELALNILIAELGKAGV